MFSACTGKQSRMARNLPVFCAHTEVIPPTVQVIQSRQNRELSLNYVSLRAIFHPRRLTIPGNPAHLRNRKLPISGLIDDRFQKAIDARIQNC